jgi:hypothetical protein
MSHKTKEVYDMYVSLMETLSPSTTDISEVAIFEFFDKILKIHPNQWDSAVLLVRRQLVLDKTRTPAQVSATYGLLIQTLIVNLIGESMARSFNAIFDRRHPKSEAEAWMCIQYSDLMTIDLILEEEVKSQYHIWKNSQ